MAVKTFTTGEVLTASDTNTYLNNGGLVYISATTFTTTATANFENAFSSTYRNYRAIIELTASAGAAIYLRLLVGSTVQTGNILSIQNGYSYSGGVSNSTRGDQYALFGGGFTTYPSVFDVGIYAPQVATYTTLHGQYTGGRSNTDSDYYDLSARNIATTQIDGFQITTATATTLTGTMRLYGVRNA